MIPILIVDDVKEDLLLAERVFRQSKIVNPIDLVSSGAACVEYLENRCRPKEGVKTRCCLLFLDLGMAPMSGVQTMEAINELVLESKPWIIMLSGMTDVKQIRRGYELGARTFINKPLRAEEVSEFVENNRGSIRRQMTSEGYQLHWI